jgi:hypothetical protein
MMTKDGMLHAAHRHQEDSSIPRWGGLAGIGGSVLFVVVFAIVVIFAGPEPAGPAGPISRFPEIRVARTVENGLYLAVLALWVPLALALFHSLRRTAPASALFGSALKSELASQAIRAGLVDEFHLFLTPVVVGGGTPFLPDHVRLALDLLDEHVFGNGVVHLHYGSREEATAR